MARRARLWTQPASLPINGPPERATTPQHESPPANADAQPPGPPRHAPHRQCHAPATHAYLQRPEATQKKNKAATLYLIVIKSLGKPHPITEPM